MKSSAYDAMVPAAQPGHCWSLEEPYDRNIEVKVCKITVVARAQFVETRRHSYDSRCVTVK